MGKSEEEMGKFYIAHETTREGLPSIGTGIEACGDEETTWAGICESSILGTESCKNKWSGIGVVTAEWRILFVCVCIHTDFPG